MHRNSVSNDKDSIVNPVLHFIERSHHKETRLSQLIIMLC